MTINDSNGISALGLREAWAALADGLHAQRLLLHLDQIQQVLADPPPGIGLFSRISAATLVSGPEPLFGTEVQACLQDAGLLGWVDLAAQYARTSDTQNPLQASADKMVEELLDGIDSDVLRTAVRTAVIASAWWVGAFATIRHRGVHHLTLEPVSDDIDVEVLLDAARIVALGTATRLLGRRLHSFPPPDGLQPAYCRAVVEGILAEQRMPELILQLGELRLVDLVTTSVPWRGQFTKYAAGTGAGQVE